MINLNDTAKGWEKVLLAVTLSIVAAIPMIAVQTAYADEDRPVIKVPRGGGRDGFNTYCVLCHKYDGRGGQSEGGYGADLRVTKLTEAEVLQTITNGRQDKGMPAFKGIIDDELIESLARFVKADLKLKD